MVILEPIYILALTNQGEVPAEQYFAIIGQYILLGHYEKDVVPSLNYNRRTGHDKRQYMLCFTAECRLLEIFGAFFLQVLTVTLTPEMIKNNLL